MKAAIGAILTGDIVNSTKLEAAVEKRLLAELKEILSPYTFEFYRGDSFQVYVEDARVALRTVMLCRTAAIGLQKEEQLPDIRISIGIGEVTQPIIPLGSAKGEAFILSGRSFDDIQKTNSRFAISSNHDWGKLSYELIATYANSIFGELTPKQAEVIFHLLQGETQQKIAERLNKSKSTISQFASSGKWNEIEYLLEAFNKITEKLSTR